LRALDRQSRGEQYAPMRFGFALPGRGPLARADVLIKLAEKADALRYSSIFVTDHVVIPVSYDSTYPYAPSGRPTGDWSQGYMEPLALMSFLAGATSRVRLGTSVLVIPYRNPVVTAKMLATLDVMSGGRVILGAGVGWLREEFEAVHAPAFAERGRVTDEYLRLMRECWTREPVEWSGAYYRMAPVSARPKPVHGGIPIWTGGHTDAALRRAGELADGWHPLGHRPPANLDPPEYAEKVAMIHDWARKAGREPKDITLSLRTPLELVSRHAKPSGGERAPFRGRAAEVIQDVKDYQAVGVSDFIFDLAPQDLRGQLAMMERFADDVRPKTLRPPGRMSEATHGVGSGARRPSP
jgi:probable F420-dependent oxidoreductase